MDITLAHPQLIPHTIDFIGAVHNSDPDRYNVYNYLIVCLHAKLSCIAVHNLSLLNSLTKITQCFLLHLLHPCSSLPLNVLSEITQYLVTVELSQILIYLYLHLLFIRHAATNPQISPIVCIYTTSIVENGAYSMCTSSHIY